MRPSQTNRKCYLYTCTVNVCCADVYIMNKVRIVRFQHMYIKSVWISILYFFFSSIPLSILFRYSLSFYFTFFFYLNPNANLFYPNAVYAIYSYFTCVTKSAIERFEYKSSDQNYNYIQFWINWARTIKQKLNTPNM